MRSRRRRQRRGSTFADFSAGDPTDPLGNLAGAVVVDGGRWLFGRLIDRLRGRGPASDPLDLPLAEPTTAEPMSNVRVTRPPTAP